MAPRWLRILNYPAVRWPLVVASNTLSIVLGAPLVALMIVLLVLNVLGELLGLKRFTAAVCWLERNMLHPVGEAILTGCARFRAWQNALIERYGLK